MPTRCSRGPGPSRLRRASTTFGPSPFRKLLRAAAARVAISDIANKIAGGVFQQLLDHVTNLDIDASFDTYVSDFSVLLHEPGADPTDARVCFVRETVVPPLDTTARSTSPRAPID